MPPFIKIGRRYYNAALVNYVEARDDGTLTVSIGGGLPDESASGDEARALLAQFAECDPPPAPAPEPEPTAAATAKGAPKAPKISDK